MKKTFFLAGLLLVCSIFPSCSSSDDFIENNEEVKTSYQNEDEVGLEMLRQDIANLNSQKFGERPETRGLFTKLKKLFCIALSDAVGGIVGSLGGATGCIVGAVSASTYVATRHAEDLTISSPHFSPSTNPDSVSLVDAIIIPADEGMFSLKDSMGYYHNAVILDLKSKCNMSEIIRTPTMLVNNVCESVLKVTGRPATSITAVEMATINTEMDLLMRNNVVDYICRDDVDLNVYSEILSYIYPDKANVINVVKEALCGLERMIMNEDTERERYEYIKIVLNYVYSSRGISNVVKRQVADGLLIGNASCMLWNVDDVD